jgi:hypothetical protein
MDKEIFVDIENYEGLYQISNFGRVYSLISGKFLKPKKHKDNYLRVGLCKNGKHKGYLIHRLVASAFIPNPLNYKEVNHKDENPSNNHVENLEFCDRKYNINYGSRTERTLQNPNYKATREKALKAAKEKTSKKVLQFDKDGEFVKEYPSTSEASRQTGIGQSNISNCCNGKLHSAGKFLWRFKDVS